MTKQTVGITTEFITAHAHETVFDELATLCTKATAHCDAIGDCRWE
jgi:hypothetical protein